MVKNLLLVPPPLELRSKVEERKRQRRAAGCIDSEKVIFLQPFIYARPHRRACSTYLASYTGCVHFLLKTTACKSRKVSLMMD